MAHACPECLDGVPDKIASAEIGERHRNHDRQLAAKRLFGLSAAMIAELQFSVSNTVSISTASTPPSTSASICSR
jgi:hypothetical protein